VNRQTIGRVTAIGVSTAAVAAGITALVVSDQQVAHAVAAEQQAQARPPRVVTRTVTRTVTVTKPVFGESALYGAYAAGQIQAGGYTDSAGNLSYTISDQTCSEAYAATTRSMPSSLPPLDRNEFMNVCLTDIGVTAKQDTGQ
jgi:hypothetical protein